SFLEDQRIRSSQRQTVFALLFVREFLQERPDDLDDLVASLQARQGFQAMVVTPNDYFSTSLALTPDVIPNRLGDIVADENVAYEFTRLERQRTIAYGSPLPPAGTNLYLFYSLEDIDRTASILLRVLLVASLAVLVATIAVAQRVGGRLIRPLVEVSSAAQRVAEGLLETRVAPVSKDELGLLAASFNDMAAALQGMIDHERRFVANVSHELRTPLATLRTASEHLSSHAATLSPGAREAVELIVEDVANLNRLVRDLMEISEADSGRAVLRPEQVDMHELVHAVAGARRLDVSILGPHAVVTSDKARLERIIGNLLDNAYEHGLGVDVSIRITEDPDSVAVAVSDAGPGVPHIERGHIFERFFKSDSARTRDRGGVGLGLAIAAENARLLGGTLRLEATSSDHGATFVLQVPKLRPSEGA
ncbi:MAG TPA: HAMP domain-containing sensor histidine kinase, partial [Actinomycetota bacterium]|nr:HAMP domain-containing sensor histidine kinase [Actinomycetota bacterium]